MSDEQGIPWSRVERRLQNAEVDWLATVRPDGDDGVIVEGAKMRLPFRDHPTLALLAAKYRIPAEQMAEGNEAPALCRLEPLLIYAWFEGLYLTSTLTGQGVLAG